MCGFVGMIATDGALADARVVERMAATLRHRGPDDEGTYTDGPVGLGFRRLAILDLHPTGHQPMVSEDGELVLVFNGEIYNFVEIREQLGRLGHSFRSTGDTEVLLHAYMEWGPDCLERLNGMWAFVIYDKRRGVVFGSRDRFGKKPLYYYRRPQCFLLGSEIKALLASGHYREGVNWKKACAFLLSSSFSQVAEDNETFYAGIEQVAAGTAFEIDMQGRLKQWPYWSIDQYSKPVNEADPAEAWGETFEDSVRLRLRSDVPVGIFLSGGMDSTSIACAVARLRAQAEATGGKFLAFSFQSPEHDESRYIRDTVNQTGVELISFRPNPRVLLGQLEKILWYQDEPIHSMVGLITFELSRLAAEHGVKVILNGGGADEYLGGYRTLFPNYWHAVLQERGAAEARREIESYCNQLQGDPGALFREVRRTRLRAKLGMLGPYRKLAAWRRRRKLRQHPWFTADFLNHAVSEGPDIASHAFSSVLRRNVEQAPLPHYLRLEDRNSMAHSVETRMPFLDYRLVNLAFQLPDDWKMRGQWNKFLLREAMRDRIPESVRTRVDKMGFPVPSKTWFAGSLWEPTLDTVASREFRERGIYEVAAIRKDMEAHQQGNTDVSSQLFGLMQFEVWSKLFNENLQKPVRW